MPSSATGPSRPAAAPAAMTAAAPRVGSAAAYPGQAVSEVISTAEAAMAARPSQPSATARPRGIRATCATTSASAAPTHNSHILVVETKKARSGDAAVCTTDQANDGTATAIRATPRIGRTGDRRTRRATSSARMISNGQAR